ncbi:methyl-accepting chemotaxis protein [Paenibacillus spongiae]|uniref:Methyl-accepting chemotaxis protein n=1 Tax=Paenibacillus spongiae TaxID=2909671 RepID=A0ABY5S2E7_9BACL|nr:methyl-accepting chemotaxis protein [Paenibacillus spongiae]UVI28061.1 methyl-accepting chemotaxis protein [Paenibacillus spongiae]
MKSKEKKKVKSKAESMKSVSAFYKSTRNGINISSPMKSVGVKLFFIIFSAILLCVLVVGLSSYSTSKSIIKKKVSEFSTVALGQSTGKLDLMFQNYEDLSMQMMLDKSLQAQMQVVMNSTDEYTKFEAVRKITDSLMMYIMGNQTVASVNLIPLQEGKPTIANGTSIENAQQTDWFKQVVEQDGRVLWIPVQPKGLSNSGAPTFALSRLIKNTSTNEGNFVLALEIHLKQLTSQLEDLNIGEGSKITIIDSDNKIVYDTDLEHVGKPAEVTLPKFDKKKTKDAFEATDNAGEDVLAIYNNFDSMNWRLLGAVPVHELVKDAGRIQGMTWIIAGLAALLAIGIGIFVIRMVAIPLVKLRNLMNEGEQGNLSVRSDFKGKDEIGQLSQSFNQMMTQITELVNQTNQSAQDVLNTAGDLADASKKTAISAKEIAVATEEIANGATSLAVEAEKGSDLTGDMGQQMNQVMSANGQMGSAAMEVEMASQQGTSYMNILIEKTGLTEEMIRSMVEKVDRLKESTRSIRKILDMLNNISKQTNILSLNATIEAARAGTAGKGFMVVADEIRKLADQSRQSIDIVGQITETIQKEIDETVQVLSNAYPIFQEQIGSVKEANQIFLTVQSQMGEFVQRLQSVTESITVLEHSQVVLSEAMGNVSAVAEESSATSEEVASLSNEQTNISEGLVKLSDKLETVSKELKESLSRFRTS